MRSSANDGATDEPSLGETSKAITMRTIYLGDTYRYNADHKRTGRMSHHQVDAEREPRGRNKPVFDRKASGGRDDFKRDWQDDDETVLVRRGGYGSKWSKV